MPQGLASITEAIVAHNKLDIKLGSDIGKIEQTTSGYRIKTNQGVFNAKKLALCTSVTAIPELVVSIAPAVADKIAMLKYQKIESLGVVVPKDATALRAFAGLVPIDDNFFSAVSRDTVPDDMFRGFTFHFKPGILSNEQKIEKACSVLGVRKDQIVDTHEKLNVVPSLRLGHYQLIEEIDLHLKGGNLFLSGNYFAGLSIEDCVARSKEEVERLIRSM
jgi:protoporphyrinogen oxidase